MRKLYLNNTLKLILITMMIIGSKMIFAINQHLNISKDVNNIQEAKVKLFSSYTKEDGLVDDYGSYVYVDNAGTIYVGTRGGLAIRKKGESKFTNYTTADGLGENYIIDVYVDDIGTVYVGTHNGLAIRKNGESRFTNYTTTDGLGGNFVYSVYVDAAGTIYVGTHKGLSIRKNGESRFTNYTTADGLGGNYVYSVYAKIKNNAATIYAGTENGLSIHKNGESSFTNYTSKDGLGGVGSTERVYVDDADTIYAAVLGGLSIRGSEESKFTNYTTADGLGSDLVFDVYVDSAGTIYAGTESGLSIRKFGKSKFINYTTEDGLASPVVRNLFVDKKSNIYLTQLNYSKGKSTISYFDPHADILYIYGVGLQSINHLSLVKYMLNISGRESDNDPGQRLAYAAQDPNIGPTNYIWDDNFSSTLLNIKITDGIPKAYNLSLIARNLNFALNSWSNYSLSKAIINMSLVADSYNRLPTGKTFRGKVPLKANWWNETMTIPVTVNLWIKN